MCSCVEESCHTAIRCITLHWDIRSATEYSVALHAAALADAQIVCWCMNESYHNVTHCRPVQRRQTWALGSWYWGCACCCCCCCCCAHRALVRRTVMSHCNTLQHTATHCNTLQHTQHTATHGNTLVLRRVGMRMLLLLLMSVSCVST